MAISSIHIGNFKGINEEVDIEIKPITVFIGPNSSGKSSCIHALACLSQTVKVTNDTRPLILDDEFANVHLGRFIEVVHSKSYQDRITLGVSSTNAAYFEASESGQAIKKAALCKALYRFKCTKRTQDLHLESADITVKDHAYQIKQSKEHKDVYNVTHTPSGSKTATVLEGAFFVDRQGLIRSTSASSKDHFNYYPLYGLQSTLKSELSNTFYLGPFRQAPLRRYATRGSSPIEVGPLGESTITLLANESVQSNARAHLKQIALWLSALGLAKTFDVSRIARSDLFDVMLTLNDGETFPIADLGYGLSQVLPVLAQCSFAPDNSTLMFEQPELHLHTIAARKLASVFSQTVKHKKCHIMLETHSPELVKEFVNEMRAGRLGPNDLAIYRVTRVLKETKLQKIEIDADNDFDIYENWEKGVST